MVQRVLAYAHARVAARLHALLPDPHDARYPRPGWVQVLREGLTSCWVVLVAYVSFVLTNGELQIVHGGLARLGNGAIVSHLLLLDRLIPLLESQWWLLLAALALLGLFIMGWRWAVADAAREARVLVVRLVRGAPGARRAEMAGVLGARWLRHKAILVLLVSLSALLGLVFGLAGTVLR